MKKSWIIFAAKVAVSGGLLWFIAANFDIGASAARLRQLDMGYLLTALGVFILLLANNTLRWRTVMRAIDAVLPLWQSFQILYVGVFFNQTLPSSVGGDAVRMILARKHGLSLQGAVNGVMLERVVNVFGLIVLVVATQPFLLARIGDNPAKFVFPALAAVAVAGIVFLMLLDRIPERYRRWSLVRGAANLAGDTKRLFLAPARAMAAVGFGILGMVLLSLMVYFIALSLGIAVSPIDCLVLVPPVMLIASVPISIAGWGLRETAMVAAFGFVGVAEGDAFVLSLLFGLAGIVAALPGGLIWLLGGYRQEAADED
ncbi:MAG: flippase-like domain-containing protein [Rhodospirillaceae bacterium]|nr:flippase-like domain-containing protein [Rhodospirillaceae bacterium]